MGGLLSKGEEILRKTIEAAINATIEQIMKKGENEEGINIEFRPEDLQKLSNFYEMMNMASKQKLSSIVLSRLLREYVLHAQNLIVQPSLHDTSHNYRTWTLLTEYNYYARTLSEVENQYTTKVTKEDQERIQKDYLKLYERLAIKDTDSEEVKKEKQELIDQIPHAVKVAEALFTRSKEGMIKDETTNFFLPCFGQWFVEQAFKTGPYIDAHIGIEEMTPEEFKQQWGENRIDLSNVYGVTSKITNALRSKIDGKLKVQIIKIGEFDCEFPPKLVFGKKPEELAKDEVRNEDVQMFLNGMSEEEASKKLYALGHPRFNLHFGLVFIQTLWIREHNNVCEFLKKNNPEWNDERIFQTARMICIAELCKVVIEDYIKHIMNYSFSLEFDPQITWDTPFQYTEHANYEFNFLYRWHSLVPDTIIIDKEKLDYSKIIFDPKIVQQRGMKGLIDDLTGTNAARLGLKNTPEFLKYLETTTLLHSRVLKTKTYNEYRSYFGLKKATKFSDISTDEDVQKKLAELYEIPDNVDWYVGILAEDHLGNGMMGPLMQTQIGIYAFAAIFSNPLCSKLIFNEKTFTKDGLSRIKSLRLSELINRNLQETGCKPYVNPQNDPQFDCFSSRTTEFKPAYELSVFEKKTRNYDIEKTQSAWPIYQNSKPWHLDDSHSNVKFIANTLIQSHSVSLAKRQLAVFFKTFFASLKTHSFLSTFKTQVSIISSILSSPSKYMSEDETSSFISAIDSIANSKNPPENNDLIDNTFGEISRIFSNYQCEHLKNFIWNQDKTFGELILNGLDPTQLRLFKESQLDGDFKEFKHEMFEYLLRFHNLDFLKEVQKGNIYYVDNYETMDLIKTNKKITRPRGLFYWNGIDLLPIGIQLNDHTKSKVKVKVVSGKNLPKMDLLGKTDTYIEIYCGKYKQSTTTKWLTYNPVWNQEFEFQCDHEDVLKFVVYDNDIITSEEMGRFEISIENLSEKPTQFDCKIGETGTIQIEIQHFHPKENLEKRIYTPKHNNWTIAKLFFGNAFVIHHEIVSHNLKCHSLMEVVSICVHHTLYEKHPIHALLEPHLYYTDVINLLARKTLMLDDGSGLVSQLFSCARDGYTINDHFWDKFDYSKYIFPEAIKERGVNIDRFYYLKDGQKMWDAIEKYVKNIITYYYEKVEFTKDYELMNFIKMLQTVVKGMMKVENLNDLIRLITSFIFNSTSHHTCLHYSQLDQLSFAPLLPTYMNDTPPPYDDISFGEVKNGELSAKQQQKLFRYLPTMGQAIMINSTFEPVTKKTDTPLLSDKYQLFKTEPCSGYFREFQKDIKKISEEILKDENRSSKLRVYNDPHNLYPYMGKNSRSINL